MRIRGKAFFVAIFVVLSIVIFPLTNAFSVKNMTHCTKACNDDSHIIDDPRVPYVKQTTKVYCVEASVTMLINYYGFNATIEEILHDLGCGYSLACYRFIPSVSRVPFGGLVIYSSTPSDMSFLAGLFNLSFHDYSVRNQSEDILWEMYWTKVKKLIRNDIPVLTAVDARFLTYWKEFFKRHNISENETLSGSHAIVIVGYNDSNGTVCYNDPGVGVVDTEENGTYIFEKQEIFKKAVMNWRNESCKIWVFQKTSGFSPPSHMERFEKAHKRNIRRMKGEFEAYFGFNISDLPFLYRVFSTLCLRFGINAIETLEKNFKKSVFHRLITVNQYSKPDFEFLIPTYELIYMEKHNVSQYLLENKGISPVCEHDGLLLENESRLWEKIYVQVKELNEIGRNNSLLKTLVLTWPLLDEISRAIDEIIEIENMIIE